MILTATRLRRFLPLLLWWRAGERRRQRHLLANPAGMFSVQKFYAALKSQGLPVGKNTLHDYLAHLEDAFLVRTVSLHTASERQRMVNPRKAYPIDPGLISLYGRTGRANLGHALETTVFLELERRGCQTDYVRTRDGYEVDSLARYPQGDPTLIQVCTDVSEPATYQREVRALSAAVAEYRGALPLLLTFDTRHPVRLCPSPCAGNRPSRGCSATSWRGEEASDEGRGGRTEPAINFPDEPERGTLPGRDKCPETLGTKESLLGTFKE